MGSPSLTGISAQSNPGALGNGGDLVVDAASILLSPGGVITSGTFGVGRGGDISVRADSLAIRGGFISASATTGSVGAAGNIGVKAATLRLSERGSIGSTASGTGDAGDLVVDARRLSIESGGFLSVSTLGSGKGGDVLVHAHSLRIDGSLNQGSSTGVFATSRSTAPDAGPAGSITIDIAATAELSHGGQIDTEASNAAAGGLTLSAGHSVVLNDHSFLSATASKDGGDVHISAPLIVSLAHGSSIRTQSSGENGGNISIDPLIFRLGSKSFLTANGGVNGGNVNINAQETPGVRFHNPSLAGDNLTAVGKTGVSGTVDAAPTMSDVAAALIPLDASLSSSNLTLQSVCPRRLDDLSSSSSFLITGRGGTSMQPGGFMPAMEAVSP
jgi:large exoprotein involved in heme utilization and adhesion